MLCEYPNCPHEAVAVCDVCPSTFCDKHGTVGVLPEEPNICHTCGGYNADA